MLVRTCVSVSYCHVTNNPRMSWFKGTTIYLAQHYRVSNLVDLVGQLVVWSHLLIFSQLPYLARWLFLRLAGYHLGQYVFMSQLITQQTNLSFFPWQPLGVKGTRMGASWPLLPWVWNLYSVDFVVFCYPKQRKRTTQWGISFISWREDWKICWPFLQSSKTFKCWTWQTVGYMALSSFSD